MESHASHVDTWTLVVDGEGIDVLVCYVVDTRLALPPGLLTGHWEVVGLVHGELVVRIHVLFVGILINLAHVDLVPD